ncbi:DNA-binding transcriptional regulator BolA-like [Halichondria panicea]|uniref:DNA-binding transcriptional regulator BolA-like n=1 Tax=Halichondria panicea TaxID=6063 RepID=UPI00312BAC63
MNSLRSAVILQRLISLSAHVHTASMSSREATGEVQRTIHTKLEQQLTPLHLEVINESHMHNVPKGSESHFKVVVVSDKFEGVALIKRHRLIMDALGEQLQQGVHALSIQADTPARWESRGEKITQSPPCLGGSKR